MKYTLLVFALFMVLTSVAQVDLHDYALKRSLKQDGLHYMFTVLDADKPGVRHHKQDKFYFWMKAQTVLATQGASSGQLLHGEFEAFYQNKQLARKGMFSKGLKNGQWKYWREDGTLEKSEHWSQGKLHGKQTFFDAEGSTVRTEYIHRNRSKTVEEMSIVYNKSNDRKTVILKDSLGQISEILRYKDGQLHGVSSRFENGKRSSKTRYKSGEIVEKKIQWKKDKVDNEDPKETEIKEPKEKSTLSFKERWQKWFGKEKGVEKVRGSKKEKVESEKKTKKEKSEKSPEKE